MSPAAPIHAKITGPIVMIGFGSIGKGTLPLIERHFDYDKSRFIVIDPKDEGRKAHCEKHGCRFIQQGVTRDNYRELLTPLLTEGGGQGFCVNLSVDTGSVDIMELCNELGALYIDTVNEPWLGFYFDTAKGPEARSNYALRETMLAAKQARPRAATTAVSCCGANPGMVSWFVKQALLDVAARPEARMSPSRRPRGEWAELDAAGSASRASTSPNATPSAPRSRSRLNVFVNTWSVEGFVVGRPAAGRTRLGHARKMDARERPRHPRSRLRRRDLSDAARRQHARALLVPDAAARSTASSSPTTSRSRSPTTSRCATARATAVYRPTCHYAYHPADDAVLSLHEMFGRAGKMQEKHHILDENEIVDGIDELGVLLYGHDKNAYWYGSQLSIEETRELAPYQNATGLQVTSAVLAGMVWALENPTEGIVEADEMDFRSLPGNPAAVSRPGEGLLHRLDAAHRTGPGCSRKTSTRRDPWQFRNVLVR